MDHPKLNQNMNMARKILMKKKLKTSSYLMMKVIKNSAVREMNYMEKKVKEFLYTYHRLGLLVSTILRKCGSH